MKKVLIIIMCMLSSLCHAQNDFLVFDIGGGINGLKYATDDRGSAKPSVGITVRGGYRHFFNKNWGAGINVVFKTCATNCTLDFVETIGDAVDSEGEKYEHRVCYKSLKEKQSQSNISLPIGVYYRRDIATNLELTAGAGVLWQTTISNKYKISDGKVETVGYYAEDNITFDEMPQHDFYNVNNFSGEYEYKNSLGAYGEVGVAREIGENVFLSLCFYGSYGLATCMEDFDEPVYDYQTMKYIGVLNSEITSKKHQIAFGVLIGLRFGLSGNGGGKGRGHAICPAYSN